MSTEPRTTLPYHYDTGNEFFELWLDPRMVYSCALYEEGDTLARAQLRKLDHHIHTARARNVERVLEIGTGWGAMARAMVEDHGVAKVVGLTISEAQYAYITARPDPRIEMHLQDVKTHVAEAPYDAIIACGSLEEQLRANTTFDEKVELFREFFGNCHRWLRPGGYMSAQSILRGFYFSESVFGAHLFNFGSLYPGVGLNDLRVVLTALQGLFDVVSIRLDGAHYERTAREWLEGLRAQREKAVPLVGATLYGRYEAYLESVRYLYEHGGLQLLRIGLRRLGS